MMREVFVDIYCDSAKCEKASRMRFSTKGDPHGDGRSTPPAQE
jgi:hypothetical protein